MFGAVHRYSASGEREQKRQYPLDTNDHASSHRNPWVYYLLGGNKEQLSVWHGQEIWLYDSCLNLNAGRVYMYPFEYNTFLGGLARVSTAVTQQTPVEGTKRFHIADHLGSVRVAIDPVGARTELDYEPFGKATVAQFTVDVPRQTFIDKEKDAESGLGDFGVRKYEEETGRFMSVDALWEKYRGITAYHYALNQPTRLKDPSGLVVPRDVMFAELRPVNSDGSVKTHQERDNSGRSRREATAKKSLVATTAAISPPIKAATDLFGAEAFVPITPDAISLSAGGMVACGLGGGLEGAQTRLLEGPEAGSAFTSSTPKFGAGVEASLGVDVAFTFATGDTGLLLPESFRGLGGYAQVSVGIVSLGVLQAQYEGGTLTTVSIGLGFGGGFSIGGATTEVTP